MSPTLTTSLCKQISQLSGQKDLDAGSCNSAIAAIIKTKSGEVAQTIQTLQKNLGTLSAQKQRCIDIIAILEEAGGLTVRARSFVSTPQDAEKYRDKTKDIENLFAITLEKLENTIRQSGDDGINLMIGEILVTPLDAKGEQVISTHGIPLTVESLGIRSANFTNSATVQNSRIDIMNAIDMGVTLRNIIDADMHLLESSLILAQDTLATSGGAIELLSHQKAAESISALRKIETLPEIISESLAHPAQQIVLDNFAASPKMEDI